MKNLGLIRMTMIWSLAFLMSNIPSVLFAQGALLRSQEMVPTSLMLEEFSRSEAENNVAEYLGRPEVERQLIEQGISQKEITARLASLSEQEIRQLSSQVKEARAGGDVLFTILIVMLIIFIAQRI